MPFKYLTPIFSLLCLTLGFSVTSEVHAQSRSGATQSANLSSSVFIRFNEGLNMNFRSGSDISQVQSVLGPGSVVQIPSAIAQYNQDGSINLNNTIDYWLEFAQHQQQSQGYSHYAARQWNCSQSRTRCDGVSEGEIFLPIRVVRASGNDVNLGGSDSYGYLALDYLRNNVDPSRYQTMRASLSDALSAPTQHTASISSQNADSVSAPSGETTTPGAAATPAPVQTPSAPATASGSREIFNCNNTQYTSNYQRTSCLADMTQQQRTELVMQDVLEINRLRPEFNMDPRFSACIAHRESHMSPNARGGSPDWGMYQVIDATGRYALRSNAPVTPGFEQYRNNWTQYRDRMIRSTLAQADLHHSVLLQKARENNLLSQINSGTTDVSVYRRLATRYNGSGAAATRYGNAVANCYQAMLRIADRNGHISNPSQLAAALRQAQ